MPNVLVQDASLRGIADAIREKNKSSLTYKPADMAAAINSLPTGGSTGPKLGPIKGDEGKDFFNGLGANNVRVKDYLSKVLFTDSLIDPELGLTNMERMFYNTTFTEIPITIYYAQKGFTAMSMFSGSKVKKAPLFRPARSIDPNNLEIFRNLWKLFYSTELEEIPEDWLDWDEWRNWKTENPNADFLMYQMFSRCYYLKSIPQAFLDLFDLAWPFGYDLVFESCERLNKIENMGYKVRKESSVTGPKDIVKYCMSLSKFTFKNNGPTAWDTSNLDLSYCGWGGHGNSLDYWNRGFTRETEVTDDATYQALKNTDYWTTNKLYSRYNHTSMVETINSLPEIIKIGSESPVNTIKFGATQGDSTDEGGASNLTEEEIAVASAKGWTVSII